jgi:hypothetical protein
MLVVVGGVLECPGGCQPLRSDAFCGVTEYFCEHQVGIMNFYIPCILTLLKPAGCVMLYHFNPLNAELNLICHLLALLGAHRILYVSRIRVNIQQF